MGKLFTPATVSSGFNTSATITSNFEAIEAALDKCVSREGNAPNSMSAALDMNTNNILNAGTVNCAKLLIDGAQVPSLAEIQAEFTNGQATIDASVTAAQTAETNAQTAETNAQTAETNAEAAAASVNLPVIQVGDSRKVLAVNDAEGAYELVDTTIESSITYQIGPTGDYPTINAALEDLTKKYPAYKSPAIRVTLNLEAGFVMAEQVIVDGLNLGWITITGSDAVTTINRSALTTSVTDPIANIGYPAFGGTSGATLPRISQQFTIDTSGAGTSGDGVLLFRNSSVVIDINSGVTQAPKVGLFVLGGSRAVAAESDFSTTVGDYSLVVRDNSHVVAYSGNFSGGIDGGALIENVSTANLNSADVTGSQSNGISCTSGSSVSAFGVNASGRSPGFNVLEGGLISALGVTGSLSQATNTLTANGIIFA